MSHKFIIITLLTLLTISFVSLAYIENRSKDADLNKDWWVLSFQNPHGSTLDFTIENHGDTDNFTYEITQDAHTLAKESIAISKGESKNISVVRIDNRDKTAITAWTNAKNKKEISK